MIQKTTLNKAEWGLNSTSMQWSQNVRTPFTLLMWYWRKLKNWQILRWLLHMQRVAVFIYARLTSDIKPWVNWKRVDFFTLLKFIHKHCFHKKLHRLKDTVQFSVGSSCREKHLTGWLLICCKDIITIWQSCVQTPTAPLPCAGLCGGMW